MIKTHYPVDDAFLSNMGTDERRRFEKWFADLDIAHDRRGRPYGDGGLAKVTGIECWAGFFGDGLDAEGALEEDLSNA